MTTDPAEDAPYDDDPEEHLFRTAERTVGFERRSMRFAAAHTLLLLAVVSGLAAAGFEVGGDTWLMSAVASPLAFGCVGAPALDGLLNQFRGPSRFRSVAAMGLQACLCLSGSTVAMALVASVVAA